MTRTILLLLFLQCGNASLSRAQIFWSETFGNEGDANAVWIHGGTNPGLSFWTWTDNPAAGYQEPDLPNFGAPTAADGYFFFNSDNNGPSPHDVTLTNLGQPVDCSGKTDVRLRFFTQYIYFNPAGTVAEVGVSTDGVTYSYRPLFDGLPANLPYHDWVEVDLDEADGQAQVYLQFRWIGNYEYHWKVDDLSLSGVGTANPDECATAVDLSPYFGQAPGEPQITGLFDNTDATVSPNDPVVTCWAETGGNTPDVLNNTLWFTFTGDGGAYDIQTVPCNATNYIGTAQGNIGDTQMLVFEGGNCTDLTPVACNDDLFTTGQPDFRAGVTLETFPGQSYYLLLDGFDNQGTAATGEFCLQITQQAVVPCSAGQVGSYALANSGFLCNGGNLHDLVALDSTTFTLPSQGAVNGLAWCFSPDSIPAGVWPGTLPGIASTPFQQNLGAPALLNNNLTLDYGVYYLTPVVIGNGSLLNPSSLPYVFNVDPAGSCYFVGTSRRLVLLPPLNNLSASAQITNEIKPPGQNGAIALLVNGGAGAYLNDASLYHYLWSNGQTTRDLGGLSSGNYTVTITDRSGCVAPLVLQSTVGQTVGTQAPSRVESFSAGPSPGNGNLLVQIRLREAADVQLELSDLQGRLMASYRPGVITTLSFPLDLSHLAGGVYLLRLNTGGETLSRRIVLR